ncbi:GTP cyclohydrolase I FolE [Buchnera aphidicola]|jgi:GTP cyclohydrolase I|uniref:GTP cyclohydrolase 1 n=1 Tax=Buchnera aphidicola subsp. Schizaphis graminum (strain Sg) TaxID=198804 RepID=GCH1_BUCAP|nr:GTP cyclohydrolase I FolE [Buchnera aphidicola]Q8KA05.1 RecName: Full=GTP cyclohydrolase 1; AltName: Full=GTP cyclohydrolase I; Short=GTP-CH-I [Buchnera aphidicola str. Sg (Schizaphis graminum)]AAM67697.1 GTP cyclohydrolase I [Buchnera aphidicola str. Sg (Schizaphis graminum)]AWI49806.1 GTP cyclohydrolase I FolE [Buchnera aphidicola (Schizaphis graminum)]
MIKITKEANIARNVLLLKGLENPILKEYNDIKEKERELLIAEYLYKIMSLLNLDLKNESLKDTPIRISKMYVNEIFSGLDYKNFPKIMLMDNKIKFHEMIIVRDILLISTCEHHFITINGQATIAYIPENKIIGLSKINRIAQFFAKRPQIQERLTKQILLVLQVLLQTKNVAIIIHMDHFCVKARGVCDTSSSTVTSCLDGLFKSDKNIREEFFFKK